MNEVDELNKKKEELCNLFYNELINNFLGKDQKIILDQIEKKLAMFWTDKVSESRHAHDNNIKELSYFEPQIQESH